MPMKDENGKGYSSEGEKISLVSSELYDQISRTGSGMSPVIRDFREKYSNVIIFSSPVIEDGRYEGIIYGVFEIQSISRAIELEFFDGAGHGFLLDYWGNILVHPKKEMVGKNMFLELSRNNSSVDTQRLKSKFLSAEPENGVYTYEGIKYYVSSVHLKHKYGMRSAEPQGGISVIMAAPYNMVFEHSTIIIRQVRGLFVLTFILFCMIIAYILYQKKENEASLRKVAYEDDLCNVFLHAGNGGKLVLDALNADAGNSNARQRAEQHTAQGISQRLAKAMLKRLYDKLAVAVAGFHTFDAGLFDFDHWADSSSQLP